MTVEALLYDIALRSLERQERQVAELRERTGTLLAAAALSTSFLGATAVERAGLSPLVVLATCFLPIVIGLSLSVLVPYELVFTLDVAMFGEATSGEAADERLIQLRIAYTLDDIRERNRPRVDRLSRGFRGASQLLIADLGLWIAALAVG